MKEPKDHPSSLPRLSPPERTFRAQGPPLTFSLSVERASSGVHPTCIQPLSGWLVSPAPAQAHPTFLQEAGWQSLLRDLGLQSLAFAKSKRVPSSLGPPPEQAASRAPCPLLLAGGWCWQDHGSTLRMLRCRSWSPEAHLSPAADSALLGKAFPCAQSRRPGNEAVLALPSLPSRTRGWVSEFCRVSKSAHM